ncbi:hypothetical protein V7021_11070, partial [Cytobacillus firmus]
MLRQKNVTKIEKNSRESRGRRMRKFMKATLATILAANIGGIFQSNSVEASSKASCSMTIQSDIHTENNWANATGPCNGLVNGFYSSSANNFHVVGHVNTQVTRSGQKFTISIFEEPFQAELTVTTILKAKPKPEP